MKFILLIIFEFGAQGGDPLAIMSYDNLSQCELAAREIENRLSLVCRQDVCVVPRGQPDGVRAFCEARPSKNRGEK